MLRENGDPFACIERFACITALEQLLTFAHERFLRGLDAPVGKLRGAGICGRAGAELEIRASSFEL